MTRNFFSVDGNLKSENRALRLIARARILSAMNVLEKQFIALAEHLCQVENRTANFDFDPDRMVDRISTHSYLDAEKTFIQNYTDSYPEFVGLVENRLRQIKNNTRRWIIDYTNNRLQPTSATLDLSASQIAHVH